MKVDIAVAGGGPVGALAAGLCAHSGFRVALASPQPPVAPLGADDEPQPRVVALAPAVQTALLQAGVPAEGWLQRACAVHSMAVAVPGDGGLRFRADEHGVPLLANIVEVQALQQGLEHWAETQGVRRVPEAADQYQPGSLSLSSGARLQAGLILACDGADSRLRQQAGIDVSLRDYAQTAIVARLRFAEPHSGEARQAMSERGVLGALPLADGSVSVVWSLPLARATELLEATEAKFAEGQAAALDPGWGAAELLGPRFHFPLREIEARAMAAPGLALLGDAAHCVHPLAGLGLNLGLADALALHQALLQGRVQGRNCGDDAVLRRWAAGRKAAVAPYQRFIDALAGLGERHRLAWGLVAQGFSLTDRATRVKQFFAEQAMQGSLTPG